METESHMVKRTRIVIPLWGEEIEINKRMVKSTKKYKGMEKRKWGWDVKTEKMTKRYPDNRKEEIT